MDSWDGIDIQKGRDMKKPSEVLGDALDTEKTDPAIDTMESDRPDDSSAPSDDKHNRASWKVECEWPIIASHW